MKLLVEDIGHRISADVYWCLLQSRGFLGVYKCLGLDSTRHSFVVITRDSICRYRDLIKTYF